jgi:hypothetical protein
MLGYTTIIITTTTTPLASKLVTCVSATLNQPQLLMVYITLTDDANRVSWLEEM